MHKYINNNNKKYNIKYINRYIYIYINLRYLICLLE